MISAISAKDINPRSGIQELILRTDLQQHGAVAWTKIHS